MTKDQKQDAAMAIFVTIVLVGAVYFLAGCHQVSGFRAVGDGLATPGQLRAASASARHEADLLDELAAQGDDTTARAFGFVEETAAAIGAPAVLGTLLGGAAGFLVPSPGQRKREKILEEAAKK